MSQIKHKEMEIEIGKNGMMKKETAYMKYEELHFARLLISLVEFYQCK